MKTLKLFFACFLVIGLLGLSAQAAIIMVPEDYETIQQAISAANDGDTIMVGEGTFMGAQIIFKKDIKIIGSGPDKTVVNAGLAGYSPSRAFWIRGHKFPGSKGDGAVISNLKIVCHTQPNPSGRPDFPWFGVYAECADDVKLSHLTIVDAMQGITNYVGDGWEITHNKLERMRGWCPDAKATVGIVIGAASDNLVAFNKIEGTYTEDPNPRPRVGIALIHQPPLPPSLTTHSNRVVHNNNVTVTPAPDSIAAGIALANYWDPNQYIPGLVNDNRIGFNDARGSQFPIALIFQDEDPSFESNHLSRNLGATWATDLETFMYCIDTGENRAFDPLDLPAPYFNPQPSEQEAP